MKALRLPAKLRASCLSYTEGLAQSVSAIARSNVSAVVFVGGTNTCDGQGYFRHACSWRFIVSYVLISLAAPRLSGGEG